MSVASAADAPEVGVVADRYHPLRIKRVVAEATEVAMNDALTPDEVDEGWAFTCQAVPVSPVVREVYEL